MTLKINFFSLLSSELDDIIKGKRSPSPGFIGPIPYLLILRWLIIIGIILRLEVLNEGIDRAYPHIKSLVIFVSLILGFLSAFLTFKSSLRFSRTLLIVIIYLDIITISVAYILTTKIESDFFLFYYLPIITAAVYFDTRKLIIVYGLVTGAFASVISFLLYSDIVPRYT